ncbi:MAG: NAD-dependent epimerase/dehydratase family protein [Bacilli bacterium]|nr:NAD-dependent epimerase/dehydratase family protein [Bacilli bacterium]
MRTYYITGITGFVGYNFYLKIKDEDVKIIAFTMKNDRNKKLFENDKKVTFVDGDISNFNDVEKFLSTKSEGEKYIIHIAGKITTLKNGDPLIDKINYVGTKNIVDVSNKYDFKKILCVSSVDAIEVNKKDNNKIYEPSYYNEEKVEGIYAKSKARANNYIIDHCKNYIIILPSAIVGPNDYTGAPINVAVNKVVSNKMKAYVSGGYNIVDVRDVVDGMLAAINSPYVNTSYLFVGHRLSIKEVLRKTAKLACVSNPLFAVPHIFVKMVSPFIVLSAKRKKKTPLFTGFAMNCLKVNPNFSPDKAIKELNYNVRDLDLSIKDTIEFIKHNN